MTIGAPAAVTASDGFGRTIASGFGTSDVGVAWSTNGSSFAVNGSQGVVTVSAAGQGPWAQLGGVSSTDVDLVAGIRLDKRAAQHEAAGHRTAPTTIRARVWLSTTAEPSTWPVSTTDSTAALQSAGSVGLFTYIPGASTNTPWVFRFDDFVARPRPAETTKDRSAPLWEPAGTVG